MDNFTVIKLEALAKQLGIKVYYKQRNAELMQILEVHPDVNEQGLLLGLNIPGNTTRSVNTNLILVESILDNIKYYNPHQNSLPKACKR